MRIGTGFTFGSYRANCLEFKWYLYLLCGNEAALIVQLDESNGNQRVKLFVSLEVNFDP